MRLEKLGGIALERGDFQEAINIFRRALEKERTAEALSGLGRAHLELGDFPTARWYLNQALEAAPHSDAVKGLIGKTDEAMKTAAKPSSARGARFRTGVDYIEIKQGGTWKPLFVKGVNLGVSVPGYFPGEYMIRKGTYRKWFAQMVDFGVNVVRVYTVHPPAFYEALLECNATKGPLYLLQGIWVEFPESMDLVSPSYVAEVQGSVREAVDAVYGNVSLRERPGHAHGDYRADVSSCLLGFLFGREWESCAVRAFNSRMGRRGSDYRGSCLEIQGASPFEAWMTRMCDDLQAYELQRYGLSHPVSAVSWPTLDPLAHPSEANYEDELAHQGIAVKQARCYENEDMETLDTAKIRSLRGGGFFASYHIYPNYPDFMNNDYLDAPDPYGRYLEQLKRHHGTQPVLVAEFGMSSSRDAAHWQRQGLHHGGKSEAEQGAHTSSLLRGIHSRSLAGGVMFSWMDEWFKRTWIFSRYYLPPERKPFWFSFPDPEENYGLIATHPGYPGPKTLLRGDPKEWEGAVVLSEKGGRQRVHGYDDGHDGARTLRRLLCQHDEGFLYLRFETAGGIDFHHTHFIIGIDTTSSGAGERRLPFGTGVECPTGLTHLIHLAGKGRSRILVCSSYDRYTNETRGVVRPASSQRGGWIPMLNLTNRRHIAKDNSRVYPPRFFSMSDLVFGSLDRNAADFDSRADWHSRDNAVELRLPWTLLGFTDPSSRRVLWLEGAAETRETEGVRLMVFSYRPDGDGVRALPTGKAWNVSDHLPGSLTDSAVYRWEKWSVPLYHHVPKAGLAAVRRALSDLPSFVKT